MKSKNIYVGIIFLILGLSYFTYNFNPLLFARLFDLWPIFILVFGVILQYIFFDIRKNFLLIISGIMMVIGAMFTINFHMNYITTHSIIAIFSLSLSVSLLNYYIFAKSNDLILPFIFLFILISIIIFLYPTYKNMIPNFNSDLVVPLLFISIGAYLIRNSKKKHFK